MLRTQANTKETESQFTTLRAKKETKRKIERAKLQFRFANLEAATDLFLILGIKTYRPMQNNFHKQ